jgi:hypothetical protein
MYFKSLQSVKLMLRGKDLVSEFETPFALAETLSQFPGIPTDVSVKTIPCLQCDSPVVWSCAKGHSGTGKPTKGANKERKTQ